MNLALMFEGWGIGGKPAISINIVQNHREYPTSLALLDRYLRQAYSADQLPTVLCRFSPVLNASILQYLMETTNGADHVLSILAEEPLTK